MATTIRVYLDGGASPVATGTMALDRTFSVPVSGVPDGTHTFDVTAQEDGKAESAKVRVLNQNGNDQIVVARAGLSAALTGVASIVANLLVGKPLAAALTATGTVAANLSVGGASHPLAAAISGAGTVAADLTAPGAPVSGIGNGGFESALASSLGTGNWWPNVTQYGSGQASLVAERSSTSPITGTYRGRLSAAGFDDYDTISDSGTARLSQRIAKSNLAATPTLGFKARNDGGGTGTGAAVGFAVTLRDAGGVDITDTTNQKNFVKLWGGSFFSAVNTSIAFVPSGTTVYTLSFGLNAFAESILAAGKIAADIASVDLDFFTYATPTGTATLSVDDAALS